MKKDGWKEVKKGKENQKDGGKIKTERIKERKDNEQTEKKEDSMEGWKKKKKTERTEEGKAN